VAIHDGSKGRRQFDGFGLLIVIHRLILTVCEFTEDTAFVVNPRVRSAPHWPPRRPSSPRSWKSRPPRRLRLNRTTMHNDCVHLPGRQQGTSCLAKPSCRPDQVQRPGSARHFYSADSCGRPLAKLPASSTLAKGATRNSITCLRVWIVSRMSPGFNFESLTTLACPPSSA
jgi:hypothetical protein